jgi:hypothetical protein
VPPSNDEQQVQAVEQNLPAAATAGVEQAYRTGAS